MSSTPVMRLVGEVNLSGANWDLDAFGRLFERLKTEVRHTGELTRYIGFEGTKGEQVEVRFFGIEVKQIDGIPEGMVAWDIKGDEWTIFDDKNAVICQESLNWKWSENSEIGRTTGEFDANCCPAWSNRCDSMQLSFRMTSNAYFSPQKELDDDVCLVDYDFSWPEQFNEVSKWIKTELGDLSTRIEHYGSTAIPDMPAKPVIDVLVEVPSFEAARKRLIPLFNQPEWEYWWYSGHMVFIKRQELMGKRTHHIHVAPAGHEIWNGLAFRDYLISHPEDAKRYAELKRELAECHKTDRERYTVAKGDFVREITAKAI